MANDQDRHTMSKTIAGLQVARNFWDTVPARTYSSVWLSDNQGTFNKSYDLEDAIAIRDHLTAVIEDIKERTREKTLAEKILAAPIGSIVTARNDDTIKYIKIGPNSLVRVFTNGPHYANVSIAKASEFNNDIIAWKIEEPKYV